ncbi:MAG: diacylglycerol kinase family protein [Ruminococcaceae bacterium]|nr:diacylglycerol kinase family protein [Oscillospiraceae bacterium]
MKKGYVLYNTKAGNNVIEEIKALATLTEAELEYIEINKITNYKVFLSGLEENEFIIICGGDGTLNRFVNDTEALDYKGEILYFPVGTGNDFALDLGKKKACAPFSVKEYLTDLPTVEVKGKTYRFINGVGYGIDGYCCEVGDKLKAEGADKVNYTSIAIKGLLYGYKPTDAVVTVDGVTKKYKKVWIAPTMHGRFYGGGMNAAPEQKRNNSDKLLSLVMFHGSGKLRTLIVFPSIFKGEHVKRTKMVEVITGHEITVEFTSPRALQIDGETILGVQKYTARY